MPSCEILGVENAAVQRRKGCNVRYKTFAMIRREMNLVGEPKNVVEDKAASDAHPNTGHPASSKEQECRS